MDDENDKVVLCRVVGVVGSHTFHPTTGTLPSNQDGCHPAEMTNSTQPCQSQQAQCLQNLSIRTVSTLTLVNHDLHIFTIQPISANSGMQGVWSSS